MGDTNFLMGILGLTLEILDIKIWLESDVCLKISFGPTYIEALLFVGEGEHYVEIIRGRFLHFLKFKIGHNKGIQ